MASLYVAAGDYQTALEYENQGYQFGLLNKTGWDMAAEKAIVFQLMKQYDSSFFYLNNLRKNDPENAYIKLNLAEAFLLTNQIDSASEYLTPALKYLQTKYYSQMNFGVINLSLALLYMSELSLRQNKYSEAMSYAREGITMATYWRVRPQIMKAYELLSKIHHDLGNNDSAYQYLQKYMLLKDSIQDRQFLFRLNNYKKEAEEQKKTGQINLLNKDNQLKEQKLKQQAIVKNGLILGIILLVSLGVFVFRTLLLKRKNEKLQLKNEMDRQQLENEKKHAELKQQAIELEMQALRAQMNPHFIFNCLSSINRFIFKNDNKAASDYLTKFSRLIRMVLIHSRKRFIPLEDELEMLKLYLDMERLRFKNGFDYSITTNNTIDAGAIFIPPLVLQPFCENAIWHGLMHKEGQGHLNISITEENKTLFCTIVDDGVGREKAAQFKSKSVEKEKSLGLKITSARLALLNGELNNETSYKIDDVTDESGNVIGTKVKLEIAYKEQIEETEHA